MITKWKQKGMPIGNASDAQVWLSVNVPQRQRGNNEGKPLPPPEQANVEGQDTWEARLLRSRTTERETSRLVQGAIASGSAAQLPTLLKSHSAAVEAVATAEKLAADARLHSGDLLKRDTVRRIMMEVATPVREALDGLPMSERSRCNPDHPEIAEKALKEWRDRLLGRVSAMETKF
jgi:hypothetical protein